MADDDLHPLDARIIELLSADARMTNAALAEELGVAASTAHARLRGLVDRGLITGFHAAVDQSRLGRGLQAIVGVTLRPGSDRRASARSRTRSAATPT